MKSIKLVLAAMLLVFFMQLKAQKTQNSAFFYNGPEKTVLQTSTHTAFISFKKDIPVERYDKILQKHAGILKIENYKAVNGACASDPLEICGFGTVALVADDPYRLGHLPSAVRERTLGEVEAQMLASPDQEVQAAGLLLGARARVESRDHIDRLVRLAVASQDPLVYAIALEGCNSWTGREAASCALLSASQLVRLDPEDAQPWLDLAAQAQAQHDPDAEFEAMRHAATARRSGSHQGFMASLVDRALGARSRTAQRTFAASESWRIQQSWSPSNTKQAQLFCAADKLDLDRRDLCEAIAATLAYRGTSVSDLGIGLTIGRSLGWSTVQLEPLQQEYDALSEVVAAPLMGADLSCLAIDRMQDWMRKVDARGERGAMREVLSRSGRSIEDWSDRHRKSATLAMVTAQAAAHSMEKETTH